MIKSPEQTARASRKAAERETRRRFILDAARDLLTQKAITDISMDDIAAAADYTRRTLYAYFSSRDDIWLCVHLEDLARRWEWQKQHLAGVEGGLARIMVWAESLYAYWKAHPQSMQVEQYWDFHGIDRHGIGAATFAGFEALNNELATALREMFRDGMADGSLRTDLPTDACISQFLYALRAILGRALSSSYSFTDLDPDEYVRHYLDQYRHSIGSDSWRAGS